jgi:hypothetical protein
MAFLCLPEWERERGSSVAPFLLQPYRMIPVEAGVFTKAPLAFDVLYASMRCCFQAKGKSIFLAVPVAGAGAVAANPGSDPGSGLPSSALASPAHRCGSGSRRPRL